MNEKQNKKIVVPGEELGEGPNLLPGPGTYKLENKILAGRLGLLNTDGKNFRITQLTGKYMPKYDHKIIAKVIDVLMTGWRVDLNSAYTAVLNLRDASGEFIQKGADLTKFYAIGDYITCKITNVTTQKLVDVTMRGPGLRKLTGGRIITINSHKVPRVIGKEGSMVTMLKQETGCNIIVGQNGLIWINGEPEKEVIAVNAIKKIEKESHTTGLTEKIQNFLQGKQK